MSKLKAEIIVGSNAFRFSFPEFTCHTAVFDFIYSKLTSQDPKERMFVDDNGDIFQVNCGTNYDYIRVYDDTPEAQTLVAPPELTKDSEPISGPFKFDGPIKYLGNNYRLKGVGYRSEFGVILAPLFVVVEGNSYHLDEIVSSSDNAVKITADWAVNNGYKDGEFIVVVEFGLLTNEAAIEYLEDLVREKRQEALENGVGDKKTAKAWER